MALASNLDCVAVARGQFGDDVVLGFVKLASALFVFAPGCFASQAGLVLLGGASCLLVLKVFSIEFLVLEDVGFVGCSVFVQPGSGRFGIDVVNEVKGDVFDFVEVVIVVSESLEVFLAAVEAWIVRQQKDAEKWRIRTPVQLPSGCQSRAQAADPRMSAA